MAILTCHISLVVRTSAEVTKPRDDRPFDGLFNINLELSAMGSPAWENGRYAFPRDVMCTIKTISNALSSLSLQLQ